VKKSTKKHAAAVALGKLRFASMSVEEHKQMARRGGQVGGRARANNLSAKARREIAAKAAVARWARSQAGKTAATDKRAGKAKKPGKKR
jgi:hypothetical protein